VHTTRSQLAMLVMCMKAFSIACLMSHFHRTIPRTTGLVNQMITRLWTVVRSSIFAKQLLPMEIITPVMCQSSQEVIMSRL
ncbi:hypothetical protein BC827DRAFT_1191059, partial [Russula dissimulans]